MTKGRLEAFSDGVIAIIITITILLIDLPEGNEWADLMAIMPLIGCYLISGILVGTNWVNHHHLLQVTQEVNGKVQLIANVVEYAAISRLPSICCFFFFCLSLPFPPDGLENLALP